MAITKNAYLRYQVLDQCFSNFQRRFYMEDLVEACCKALYEQDGIEDGVKARQIAYDIDFMESENGWSIPLERLKDGRRVYYRYSDKSFSIKNHILTQEEADQLNETINLFSRFEGLPNYTWLDEVSLKLKSDFGLERKQQPIISFQQNPDLTGLEHLSKLFNAIRNEIVLQIEYRRFAKQEAKIFIIHPYFLKQFNSRWFLFGYCSNLKVGMLLTLALDRMLTISEYKAIYIPNKEIDFNEYFDDVVGVTVYADKEPEKIILEVSQFRYPYIATKPIHPSQTVLKTYVSKNDRIGISLNVQINNELIALLLSFGNDVEVIEPITLRNRMKEIIQNMKKLY